MAHYISREELRRIEGERDTEHADKSWSDLDIRFTNTMSDRERRKVIRDRKKKEQEKLRGELEKKKELEKQRRLELEKKKQEADEREQKRIEAEAEEKKRIENEEKVINDLMKQRVLLQEQLDKSESKSEDFEMNSSDLHLDYSDINSEDELHGSLNYDTSFMKAPCPIDTSTDVEGDNGSHDLSESDNGPNDSFERTLYWLDEKLKQLKNPNQKQEAPQRHDKTSRNSSKYKDIHNRTQPKKIKEEKDDSKAKRQIRKKDKRETDYAMSRPIEKMPNGRDKEANAEVERKLKEKVARLQKKEKEMSMRIEAMKAKTEIERQIKNEQWLQEERIWRLKEKERSLVESLREKECLLTELEVTYEEEIERDRPDRKHRRDKSSNHEKHERKVQSRRKERQEKINEDDKQVISFRKPTIPKLTENTFEEWKIEVEVVLKSDLYHSDIVRQEVRNSLCGNTRKILLNMDPEASTRDLMTKLENVYGNIRTGESVLSEFYQAKQKESENVAEWGVRLESILNTAIKKGQVKKEQADEMLRNRFWRHLKSEHLKIATRVFYETTTSFEELRKKVRIEENELESTKESEKVDEKQVTSNQRSDANEQLTLIKSLLTRMEKLEEQIAKQSKQCENTKFDSQTRNTDGNQKEYESQRKGNYNSRRNWHRGNYRNRGYRESFNSNANKNKANETKDSSDKEQSHETREARKAHDHELRETKQTEDGLN